MHDERIKQRVIQFAKEGKRSGTIAKLIFKEFETVLVRQTIYNWCDENNIKLKKRKRVPANDKEIKQFCIEKAKEGLNCHEIRAEFKQAYKMSISESMVRRTCKRAGVNITYSKLGYEKEIKDYAVKCVKNGDNYVQATERVFEKYSIYISDSCVSGWCKKVGVKSEGKLGYSKAIRLFAVEYVRKGHTYPETVKKIQEKFDVTVTRCIIGIWARKEGVQSPLSKENKIAG